MSAHSFPSRHAGKSATIRDVAQRAGVSKSSVSRYLQGSTHLSTDARTAIRDAIADLDYRPSAVARSLTNRRSKAVGVLVYDLRQPWFVDFLDGLSVSLHDAGYYMLLGDTRLDASMGESLVRTFAQKQVDGLIVAGTMPISDALAAAIRDLPTVVAGNHELDDTGLDLVVPDDDAVVLLAMEHLYRLGHRRIAHIAGDGGRTFELRRNAYERFMTSKGLTDSIHVVVAAPSETGGQAASHEILSSSGRRSTAVFAANDLLAMGTLSTARSLRISVPEKLSVVSVDDSFLAASGVISLTSVNLDTSRQGILAGEVLMQRIADHDAIARKHVLQPHGLSIRSSSDRAPLERTSR